MLGAAIAGEYMKISIHPLVVKSISMASFGHLIQDAEIITEVISFSHICHENNSLTNS